MLSYIKSVVLCVLAWLTEPLTSGYDDDFFLVKDAPHQGFFFSQLDEASYAAAEVNDYVGLKVAAPMAYFTDAGASGWVVRIFEHDTEVTMGYVAYE